VQRHEKFSASIIRNQNGKIHEILEMYEPGCAEEIAQIIESDNQSDIYHAVVSSSFDADRLDFLLRDRYMTGTGAGNIDEDWLVDNLSIAHVPVSQDDDTEIREIPTFAFKLKGRAAAEDFLLARYRMYTQVYLHKTTRGFEKLLSSILQLIGDPDNEPEKLGIRADNPLVLFLRQSENLAFYEQIDDYTVWGVIGDVTRSNCAEGAALARRFLNRERLMVIDVSSAYNELSMRADPIRRIEEYVARTASKGIYSDSPTYNLYTKGDGEGEKMHKIVRVLDGTGQPKQITEFRTRSSARLCR
jgi:HD superfamily phosphohydrolase